MQITCEVFLLQLLALAVCIAVAAGLYGLGIRHGFKMGRMTQDKPVTVPKEYNPGEPVLAEEDEWTKAERGEVEDPDIPENIRG